MSAEHDAGRRAADAAARVSEKLLDILNEILMNVIRKEKNASGINEKAVLSWARNGNDIFSISLDAGTPGCRGVISEARRSLIPILPLLNEDKTMSVFIRGCDLEGIKEIAEKYRAEVSRIPDSHLPGFVRKAEKILKKKENDLVHGETVVADVLLSTGECHMTQFPAENKNYQAFLARLAGNNIPFIPVSGGGQKTVIYRDADLDKVLDITESMNKGLDFAPQKVNYRKQRGIDV